jgi:pyruvate/2-oxoglutarate dehydrogenase complex dihydrolipoamide acyltransferase (E2) component
VKVNKKEIYSSHSGTDAQTGCGKVEIRMMTPLALSYDHRVIDGGAAARFIVDLVGALQDFEEAVVKI